MRDNDFGGWCGDLDGMAAVIIGGSLGPGLEAAAALFAAGALPVLVETDPATAELGRQRLAGRGVKAHAYDGDCTDEADLIDLLTAIEADFGQIGVVVNVVRTLVADQDGAPVTLTLEAAAAAALTCEARLIHLVDAASVAESLCVTPDATIAAVEAAVQGGAAAAIVSAGLAREWAPQAGCDLVILSRSAQAVTRLATAPAGALAGRIITIPGDAG